MENRNIEGRSRSPGSGDRAGAGSRTGSAEQPWVTGLFTDRDRAERGYQALTARGYDSKRYQYGHVGRHSEKILRVRRTNRTGNQGG